MVQEDTGRFGAASRGKTGITYVPANLIKDTTFPFTNGDSLLIRIDAERLIVEKAPKRKEGLDRPKDRGSNFVARTTRPTHKID